MTRIAVVVGNPFPDSLDHALAHSYVDAARGAGAEVRVVDLARTSFALSPAHREDVRVSGMDDIDRLGPQIADMIATVAWADHLTFVYPVWWGTYPAVLKGFIDRVFLSGTAFRYGQRGPRWERLLRGRTARLLVTMDAPTFFDRLKYRRASVTAMRNPLLWYVGIKTVGVTHFDRVRFSTEQRRAGWLDRAARFGGADAGRVPSVRAATGVLAGADA